MKFGSFAEQIRQLTHNRVLSVFSQQIYVKFFDSGIFEEKIRRLALMRSRESTVRIDS